MYIISHIKTVYALSVASQILNLLGRLSQNAHNVSYKKVLSLLLSHFPFYSSLLPADIFCLREYFSGTNGRVVKPFVLKTS